MACFTRFIELLKLPFIAIFLLSSYFRPEKPVIHKYYTSIFSFGDSLADTGNILHSGSDFTPIFGRLPYGMTFFNHSTGRASDGRLIVDFIAEAFGLPFLPPYLAKGGSFEKGINFAVAGASALDPEFFVERGMGDILLTELSLSTQLRWFEDLKPSLCSTYQDCREVFSKSLFIMGEIGGNDYNYPLLSGRSLKEVTSYVPNVVEAIINATERLINHGAVEILVPGNLPVGCSGMYLSSFTSSDPGDYDPQNGCLQLLNEFAVLHNSFLRRALDQLQMKHPSVRIMYADYYHAALQLANNPDNFGFSNAEALTVCCGGAGPYNFNETTFCGLPGSRACKDPSSHINWDGLHLTEAAYHSIALALLQTNTYPPLQQHRLSKNGKQMQSLVSLA